MREALRDLRVLIVLQSFRKDTTTFAFLTDVKNLGAIQPLNLLNVGAWLLHEGAQVTFLDANARELTLTQALAEARAIDFDVVCFTVTNLDFLYAIEWIRGFEQAFAKPILVGGSAGEAYPVDVASHPEITTVFHSPAEAALGQWLEAYATGGEWWKTRGTCSVVDGEVHLNAPAPLSKRFVRPRPARELTDPSLYFSLMCKGKPFTSAMSVYGCPYPCDFCAVRRLTTHIRTPEDIVDEMEWCEKELGIQEIDYFDAGFTIVRDRVFRIAELYKRRGLRVRWSARARIDKVDRDVLRAMRSINCRWLGYGIESGDVAVLSRIHKPQGGLELIHHNLNLTKEAGIDTIGFLVLGIPGESASSIDRTKHFLRTAALDYVQISPYWPVPKTPVYDAIVRTTGKDVWRDIIVHGPQDDLPLHDTPYTMHQLYEIASGMYSAFYIKPHRVLKLLRNIDSTQKLRRYVSAGVDILRGSLPIVFGRFQ